MNRTSFQTIIGLFVGALFLVYAFAKYLNTALDLLLPVGNITIFTLALVDLLILCWVLVISPRLPKVTKQENEVLIVRADNPLPALAAARTVAFALAGSRVGCLLAGGYFGLALVDMPNLHAVAYADHATRSLIAAVLAVVLILISLWLERKCSPPKPQTSNE
ncbi:MAG: hypothetical protein RLZZ330_320 [Actinomycetota bacterium]|jgi:hypothetical protein